MTPIILDGFAGEGGAGEGYRRAGFRVVGIDRKPLGHRYRAGPFIRTNALDFIARYGRYFDAVHVSPPCQSYSIATAGNLAAREKYDRLIDVVRSILDETGRPYVIENVEQARSELRNPILLCGRMFGLEAVDEDGAGLVLDRHRLFESNVDLRPPPHPVHGAEQVAGVYGGSRRARRRPGESLAEVAPRDRHAARYERRCGYVPRSRRVKEDLLGINWMSVKGMEESIPPIYAEYLGRQLRERI